MPNTAQKNSAKPHLKKFIANLNLWLVVPAALSLMVPIWAQNQLGTGLAEPSMPTPELPDTNQAWQVRQQHAIAAAEEAMKKMPNAKTTAIAPNQLGSGDRIRLTVFGEEDLSGEFEIDNTGSLALPLVGEVKAKGLTQRELEQTVTKTLSQGYLVNPRVNVEVLSFRPFFILGEVQKPGSYAYVNNLTVINAVALGGGYTTRAKTGRAKIRRATDATRKEEWVTEDALVFPGDVIEIQERFF